MKLSQLLLACLLLLIPCVNAQERYNPQDDYDKFEYEIPMRDGVTLFTAVYIPKDHSQQYPFLMKRSPYSAAPYGTESFPSIIGPVASPRFAKEGYIFVYQDVRGRFMSEGKFYNMTPACTENAPKTCVDESTDMYDTVTWLLKNVHPNNGNVGMWGISYPGFYVAASIINSHPAIKAASPQAPIGDWFVGDDFHHHGAFFLQDAFRFFTRFEHPEPNPTQKRGESVDFGIDDAYTFYLRLGALKNANERYFQHKIGFWDSLMTHGTYNSFWQSRNIIPHLKNVSTSVMTVAGAFDAEDPYGPIEIYQSIKKNNPEADNRLVLGPWFHGGWVRATGNHLNNAPFGQETSLYYQENIDLPYFNYYLKGKGNFNLPEVFAYATGSNEWHSFEEWPPNNSSLTSFYFHENQTLTSEPPKASESTAFDAYISDPAKPVPYTQEITINRTREYMTEDQRFASRRPDVLTYVSDILEEDITLVGAIRANLFVAITGTDADFVVKLIDVFPDDFPEWQPEDEKYMDVPMSGYQMLVRAEVMRGKFRNSYEHPEPFSPGQVTQVSFDTPHIFHTFKKGHRIMIHVQSSFFPLVDRNPQQFLDIYNANDEDFKVATHRIYRSAQYPSHIIVGQLK